MSTIAIYFFKFISNVGCPAAFIYIFYLFKSTFVKKKKEKKHLKTSFFSVWMGLMVPWQHLKKKKKVFLQLSDLFYF